MAEEEDTNVRKKEEHVRGMRPEGTSALDDKKLTRCGDLGFTVSQAILALFARINVSPHILVRLSTNND